MQGISSFKRYTPVLALVSAGIMIGLIVSVLQLETRTPAKSNLAIENQAREIADNKAKAGQDSDKELLIRPPMSSFGKKVQTLEEAVSQILVKPKLPNAAVAGDPKERYVLDAPTPEQRGIGILYENGIQVWIHPNKPAPDYDEDLRQFSRLRSIDINGARSTAGEPGKKVLQGIGEVSEPGAVVWYENGIEYQIYGDNIGLKTLVPIARSMR